MTLIYGTNLALTIDESSNENMTLKYGTNLALTMDASTNENIYIFL